jgi:peptidoglycan/LPS O-acetylase OafA/YrhL
LSASDRPADAPVIRYRPDIDGLRAIAIVSVVAYHVGLPFAPGGYAGVDVFFVVSGFLITQLLVGEYGREGRISLASFYERRARRLLPGLSIVIAATLLLGVVLLPFPNAREQLGKSAIAAILFVANRYFRLQAGDYFGPIAEQMPLVHTWSLAVEEQFYLVYPLLLIVLARLASPQARLSWLRAAVATITVGSFAVSVALVHRGSVAAFYWAPARAWELGVGALAALVPLGALRRHLAVGGGAALVGMTMIVASFVWLNAGSPFPGVLALFPVLGTALVIVAGIWSPTSAVATALSTAPMVALGRVSYTWYLWHWPLLVIARRWRLQDPDVLADLGWAALALGVAILTTRFVENPIRLRRSLVPRNRWRLAVVAAAAVTLLIAAASVEVFADQLWSRNSLLRDVAAGPDPCLVGAWDNTLTFGTCAVPPPTHRAIVALWGDSHGAAWSPTVRELGAVESVTVVQVTRNGCPPLLGLTPGNSADPRVTCRQANTAVADYLRTTATRGLVGVVLAARWSRYIDHTPVVDISGLYFDANDTSVSASLASLRRGLEETLALTDSLGLRVIVLLTAPEFAHPPLDCLLVRAAAACGVSRMAFDLHRRPTAEVIRRIVVLHRDARMVDPADFYCTASFCPPMLAGKPVTSDNNHLSASAARAFVPSMRPDFLWLVAPH